MSSGIFNGMEDISRIWSIIFRIQSTTCSNNNNNQHMTGDNQMSARFPLIAKVGLIRTNRLTTTACNP